MIAFNTLTKFGIHATDGDIGQCKDVLFDDQDFVIRYFVADTHKWLPLGRKVVLSPISLTEVNDTEEKLYVSMTKDALKESPSIDDHKPLSREYEEILFKYFGYGYYWTGPGAWGDFSHPTELVDQQSMQDDMDSLESKPENHLRSCDEVNGYDISAQGEDTGHVCDFVIDKRNWAIQLFIIDTRNWLPGGKKIALAPALIKDIDWSTHKIHVDVSHDDLMALPEVDDDRLDDADYLASLASKPLMTDRN